MTSRSDAYFPNRRQADGGQLMSEAAAPDDDFDYLADLPPVRRIPDEDDSEEAEIVAPSPAIVQPTPRETKEDGEASPKPGPRPVNFGSRPVAPDPAPPSSADEADGRIGPGGAPPAGETT